ncbi:Dna-Directed Rna polymerase Ii Subunit Rpb1 [Manis pentadactyla]|nr:Dna-Directed Rna polymerase Ii Subunit Rpb1 [Manis pentadactyla]
MGDEQLLERPGDEEAASGLGRSRCHFWRLTWFPGTVHFLPSVPGRVLSPGFRPGSPSWSPFSRRAGLSGGDCFPGLLMMFDPAAAIAGNVTSKLGSASVPSLL